MYRECIARGDFVHRLCEEYIQVHSHAFRTTDTQHKVRVHLNVFLSCIRVGDPNAL